MDIERKRVAGNSSRNGVVMGSVWESRMRGSFKVFNGDNDKIQQLEKPIEKNQSSDELVEKDKIVLRSKQSFNGVKNGVGKRKTWKSDGGNNEGNERNPSQISKVRSDGNGIKKSPLKKERSSPVERTIKTRALSRKSSIDTNLVPISDESNHEVEEKSKDDDNDDDGEELDDVCEEKLITNEIVKVENEDSKENDEEQEGCNKKATLDENEMVNEERAIVIVKEMEPISKINNKKKEESEMEPISKINNKKKKESLDDDDDDDVVVIEEKKIHQRNERSNPISKTIKRQPSPPVVNHPRIISKPNEFPSQRVPKSHNKLQTFIDLIMWRDASKSALIFGVGTFSIISSSYTQDLNISFISVISYLGLIYLAAIFIFRSFLLRGVVEDNNNNNNNIIDDEESVVGEEEALWALKLFLPYINEFLLKVKALFSGDPATTMKLAVLLFILARCGSSITIWKMTKLAFFGVFTVPKICSSYSSQLTAYGTFWVERFKDAWESCSQKKAVVFGVFTVVWNLSSIVARIWAVFMLLVAFKYYQQSMVKDDVVKEEEAEQEEPITRRNQSSWQEQRNRNKGLSTESTKLRKRS